MPLLNNLMIVSPGRKNQLLRLAVKVFEQVLCEKIPVWNIKAQLKGVFGRMFYLFGRSCPLFSGLQQGFELGF